MNRRRLLTDLLTLTGVASAVVAVACYALGYPMVCAILCCYTIGCALLVAGVRR